MTLYVDEPEFKEFELKYHKKRVYIIGNYLKALKGYCGLVTAALYKFDEESDGSFTTTLGIMADGYEMGKTPEKWLTIKIREAELTEALADIKII